MTPSPFQGSWRSGAPCAGHAALASPPPEKGRSTAKRSGGGQLEFLIKSAIRSAIMIVVMFVFAHGIDGITEASQMRRF